MIDDRLEYAITQYLDGELTPTERAQLEARLAADPQAMRLLDQHRKLQEALRGLPPPRVAWDALAEATSSAIAAEEDSLERAVVAQVDGEPTEIDDPAAEPLLRQHRKLACLLRSMPPVPQVRWDALAKHISRAVARQQRQQVRRALMQPVWVRRATVALAACAAIGLGLWAMFRTPPAPPVQVAIVQGPAPQAADGPALAEISIGPSPRALQEGRLPDHADLVLETPRYSTIATARPTGQDIFWLAAQ